MRSQHDLQELYLHDNIYDMNRTKMKEHKHGMFKTWFIDSRLTCSSAQKVFGLEAGGDEVRVLTAVPSFLLYCLIMFPERPQSHSCFLWSYCEGKKPILLLQAQQLCVCVCVCASITAVLPGQTHMHTHLDLRGASGFLIV